MNIHEYLAQLEAELSKTFHRSTVDDLVAETSNHLTEQADDLSATGLSRTEAEQLAVQQFGTVQEISESLLTEYPPKPPIDPSRMRLLPEVLLAVFGLIAGFIFWEGFKLHGLGLGLQNAVASYILSTPMMVIPGVMAALTRIKFRRFRVAAMVRRLGLYGFTLATSGIAILIGVAFATRTPLGFSEYMYFGFGGVTILGYGVMEFLSRNGEVQDRIFSWAKSRGA